MKHFPSALEASFASDRKLVNKLIGGLGDSQTIAALCQAVADVMLKSIDRRNELVRLGMDPMATHKFEHHFFTVDVSSVDSFREILRTLGIDPREELRASDYRGRQGFSVAVVAGHSLRHGTLSEIVTLLHALAEQHQHEYIGWCPCVAPAQQSTLLFRLDGLDPYLEAGQAVDPEELPKLDSSCGTVERAIAAKSGFGFTFVFHTLADLLGFCMAMQAEGHTDATAYVSVSNATCSQGRPYHVDYVVRDIKTSQRLGTLTRHFEALVGKHNGHLVQLSAGVE